MNYFVGFSSNQVKANPNKFHLTASCNNELSICVNNCNITNSECEKLSGIKIDHKINSIFILTRSIKKLDKN